MPQRIVSGGRDSAESMLRRAQRYANARVNRAKRWTPKRSGKCPHCGSGCVLRRSSKMFNANLKLMPYRCVDCGMLFTAQGWGYMGGADHF
jgi:uncharacterized protein (DUF983 family)